EKIVQSGAAGAGILGQVDPTGQAVCESIARASIARMKEPWRLASSYAARSIRRLGKALMVIAGIMLFLFAGGAAYYVQYGHTRNQRDAAQISILVTSDITEAEQGLAVQVAAYELIAAYDRLKHLKGRVQSPLDKKALHGAIRRFDDIGKRFLA